MLGWLKSSHPFTSVTWRVYRTWTENLDRPALGRLHRDITDGKVATSMVWKLDRLSRNTADGSSCGRIECPNAVTRLNHISIGPRPLG
ncbi:MAG: recombinase family protein [bacterium]|nr:recombinase family protein [bacterium]